MTRSWSWRRVGARSAAGSSPTSSAGAVWRHLLFDVRRCDSNSSQIPFLSALPPSLARRRWLIFRSFAVQLSLTRPPPRSAPPPPTPRVLCPASRARFALPQSNRAPAAPAPRRVSPCARVVRPWRLKPPRDPAIEPWSPPAAAHPGFELLWHALLQVLRTFARCHHRFGRPSLPPPPPFPLRTRLALAKIELRRPVELSTARPLPVQRQSEPLPLVQEPFEPARARAGHRVRQNAWAPHGAHAHRPCPGLKRSPGQQRGVDGCVGSPDATRGADRAARARWRVVRSAGVASHATAGACGLCRRISARVGTRLPLGWGGVSSNEENQSRSTLRRNDWRQAPAMPSHNRARDLTEPPSRTSTGHLDHSF